MEILWWHIMMDMGEDEQVEEKLCGRHGDDSVAMKVVMLRHAHE